MKRLIMFLAIATVAFGQFNGDQPSVLDWQPPQKSDHWLIVYWNPPYICDLPPNSAVYCESRYKGQIALYWAGSQADALKWAEASQVNVLGMYHTDAVNLKMTETTEQEPQPAKTTVKKHYTVQ